MTNEERDLHSQAVCPSCGFANPLDFRFCGKCGAQLERSASPLATESEGPERSQPNADGSPYLFCDLVGSSMLASRLDPEELRDLILAYQTACTSAIRRFDGFFPTLGRGAARRNPRA